MLAADIRTTNDGQRQHAEPAGKGGGGDALGSSWTRFLLIHSSRPPPPSSSRPSPSSPRACVRSHPLSSVSGRSICSRKRRSCASTYGCSTQLSPGRRAWRAASSSPQPCPSAREPAEQLPERKLPLTAQAAAAYTPRLEEGLPSNTSVRQTQWRGAPSPDNSMRPGSAGAMGSQATDGGDVHVVGAAGQTQAVTHGGPEAVGKHSQVQL